MKIKSMENLQNCIHVIDVIREGLYASYKEYEDTLESFRRCPNGKHPTSSGGCTVAVYSTKTGLKFNANESLKN